jgi:hypothetical protein
VRRRFNCGHLRIPSNLVRFNVMAKGKRYRYVRCRTCYRENARVWAFKRALGKP